MARLWTSKTDKSRCFWMLVLRPERTLSLQRPTVWSILTKTSGSLEMSCSVSRHDLSSASFEHLLSLVLRMHFVTSAVVMLHQRARKKVAFTQVFIRVSWDSYARSLGVASLSFKEVSLCSLFTYEKAQGLFIWCVSAPLGVLQLL